MGLSLFGPKRPPNQIRVALGDRLRTLCYGDLLVIPVLPDAIVCPDGAVGISTSHDSTLATGDEDGLWPSPSSLGNLEGQRLDGRASTETSRFLGASRPGACRILSSGARSPSGNE
jgi:hypothetical protein